MTATPTSVHPGVDFHLEATSIQVEVDAGHLVAQAGIPAATAAELRRLQPGPIVVLGAPHAVDEGVARELGSYTTGAVTRLAGAGPLRHLRRRLEADCPRGRCRLPRDGEGLRRRLTVGAAAAAQGARLLLTASDRLPVAIRDELSRLRPTRLVVLGGERAVSAAVVAAAQRASGATSVTRLAGVDRYGTAALVAASFPSGSDVLVATAADFPDALAGVPAAAAQGRPLLLPAPTGVAPVVRAGLERLAPPALTALGGEEAVSLALENVLAGFIVR